MILPGSWRSRGAATDGTPAGLGYAGRGLDGLNLFVANIQTGFGPFIAVFLTTHGWTQTAIGFALSIGTVTSMASQVPAGALVDAVQSKRSVAALSILVFTLSALLFAIQPIPLFVYLAEILHGFSSCTLGPAIAAMSLALVGEGALGVRLGRNARFGSIGNGIGALLMGACGYYLSDRSVFFLTAGLTLPALATLVPLAPLDRQMKTLRRAGGRAESLPIRRLLTDRRLVIFAACATLFTFGNAAMLPLVSVELTKRVAGVATLYIAACIVLPQIIVAVMSPWIGRVAETRGRRLVLMLGLLPLPIRGLMFAVSGNPQLAVLVQVLDGISGACFGVLVPLVTSDVAGRTNHFNLALGFVGFAIGVGATFSTTLAGWIADRFGDPATFLGLAVVGLAALALGWAAMPEIKPKVKPAAM